MAKFEITKRSRRPNYSMLHTPAADTSLAAGAIRYPRGTAFQESSTADTAELADGSQPIIGFVTRPIAAGGPQLADSIYPGRIDLPTPDGDEASFEYAEEVQAEGSDFVQGSGSDKLDTNTALKTKVSFRGGKFCAAATTQIAEFMVVQKLTPEDSANVVRFGLRRIDAPFIP